MPSISNPQAPNSGLRFAGAAAGVEAGAGFAATAGGSGPRVAGLVLAGGAEPQPLRATAIANGSSFTYTFLVEATVLVT
jgi:hypothetical protein